MHAFYFVQCNNAKNAQKCPKLLYPAYFRHYLAGLGDLLGLIRTNHCKIIIATKKF